MEELYVGIDVGGTKCAVVLGNQDLHIYERIEFATVQERRAIEVIDEMILCCRRLIDKYEQYGRVKGIGISCGGPLDDKKGVILSPPNLPRWQEVPIVEILEREIGIPVFIQNDANACALAEWRYGAGKGSSNMIFLTFGTGLGAGLILDGRLYSGTNGMAGEAGHIRLSEDGPVGYGKAGSFEGYCSGGGIKNLCRVLAKKKMGDETEKISLGDSVYSLDKVTAKDVFLHAGNGDAFAQEIVNICAEYLGKGVAVLIDILNPEIIVIGSIFVRGEELLRRKMEEWMEKESLAISKRVCRVLPAELGEALGDVAALSVAVYHLAKTEK